MSLNRTRVDSILIKYINDYNDTNNSLWNEMAKYILLSGKALRPLIVENVFLGLINNPNNFNFNLPILDDLMVSIELLHCASLLLDDLPCMDDDKTRRGRTCFHIKYSVNDAKKIANKFILDSIRLVYKHIVRIPVLVTIIIDIIQNTAIGQYIDLINSNEVLSNRKSSIEKCNLLCLKTSTLFSLAFSFGYLSFALSEINCVNNKEIIEKCKNYIEIGKIFGRLYQLSDDFEDYNEDKLKERNMNNVFILGYSACSNIFYSSKNEFLILLNQNSNNRNNSFNNFFGNILEILSTKMNNGLVKVLHNI